MRIDWRTAVTYVTREPRWRARIGVGGLLILLLPPAGWVLALGYRSIVGNRLVDRSPSLLPAWRGHLALIARRGVQSSAVIVGYLLPFLIAFWALGATSVDVPVTHQRELALFFTGVVLFPPVAIPGLTALYARDYAWLDFSALDLAILLVLFIVPILVMPAVFLQIAQRRSFRGAFQLADAVRLVARVPGPYAEAWGVSLAVSALAVVLLPLTPWLLFWSYLVISHVFLQVLAAAER